MSPAEENTFRILNNQIPLAVHPVRCRIGWHKWTVWSKELRSGSSSYIRQGRYCVACNQYDERKMHE